MWSQRAMIGNEVQVSRDATIW